MLQSEITEILRRCRAASLRVGRMDARCGAIAADALFCARSWLIMERAGRAKLAPARHRI